MSKDINTDPIKRFLNRVIQASSNGAKDIRITTNEALEISAAMNQLLLLQLNSHIEIEQKIPTNFILDGGSFNNEKK